MNDLQDHIKLRSHIRDCIASGTSSDFLAALLDYMDSSMNDLSLENGSLLELLSFFEVPNEKTNGVNLDVSKCFDELIGLNRYQLEVIHDFIQYAEANLSVDDLALCQGALSRGKQDLEWLLELEDFYQDVLSSTPSVQLSRQEIILHTLKGSFPSQEEYFIDLLHEREWDKIEQDEIHNFLLGYDFHFLSNKAYSFVLPACLKLCIDMFRANTYPFPPIEQLSFFLEDELRAAAASPKLKKLVNRFIRLLSRPEYYSLTFCDDDLDKLVKLWGVVEK